MNENHVYDMIIVGGGGPGGYTSALYAARAGFDTIVLEKLSAGGQMSLTWQIDNYPGFENGIDGFSLAEKMQKQAEKFGAKSEYAEVFNMDLTGKLKRVETSSGIYIGKTVVIATGANPRKLGLAKEKELIGHGVAYCASCDGMFYKDKIVVVVGGGNSAVSDAFNKNVLATNPAKRINLPKKIKKTEYRVLKIDEKKTLTLPQVLRLIEASKETPIHMLSIILSKASLCCPCKFCSHICMCQQYSINLQIRI
jgi:alkyl hydroperoxide reductase subunit AhpF